MADLLYALGVLVLVFFASFGVAAALALRSLNRANRVSATRPTRAPLPWLVSLRVGARLHRRLRRAVEVSDAVVTAVAPGSLPLRQVAEELVERAVVVDDWLVTAVRLHPAVRRQQVAQLAGEVRQVEHSAARLHHLAYDWRRCLDQSAVLPVPPPDLHQRLDAVEAALRDLPAAGARATIGTTPTAGSPPAAVLAHHPG